MVAFPDRCPGIERGSFKLMLFFAGLLPILLSQFLKLCFRGLKFKVGHGAESSVYKSEHTIGPEKMVVKSGLDTLPWKWLRDR
jgi:hypothetical protein